MFPTNLEKDFYENIDDSLAQFCSDSAGSTSTLPEPDDSATASDSTDVFSNDEPRYIDAEIINQGASKKVLKAYDTFTNREIAIAMIKKKRPHNASISRFIREARITASLNHPNIISVYDIGFDNADLPYFTMNYVEGRSLSKILKALNANIETFHKHFDRNVLLRIFLKVCSAVKYAHSNNILHLDLKPSNILIDNTGNAILCDWGMAKNISEPQSNPSDSTVNVQNDQHETAKTIKISVVKKDTQKIMVVQEQTSKGHIKGTPGYMAPEQASARHKQKGKRTDIYSLGAILYSILTYKPSVSGDNLQDVIKKTLEGNIIAARELVPENAIPPELEAICSKAMAYDVNNRYDSVSDLMVDIRLYITRIPTESEKSDFLHRVMGMFRLNRIKK